jgi:hypothetical protein
MDEEFFKFPRTPYLAPRSAREARRDRVFSEEEAVSFLSASIVVEEKIDGANLGISLSPSGTIMAQNRGSYLEKPAAVQFQPLWTWLSVRSEALKEVLGLSLVLFGEWCYAQHTIRYDLLPDWFLGFDVYDRSCGKFWSSPRRNRLLDQVGIYAVPTIASGHFTLPKFQEILRTSRSAVGSGLIEGLYLRRESKSWLEDRAKIVRPQFTQSISEHWSRQTLRKNRMITAHQKSKASLPATAGR